MDSYGVLTAVACAFVLCVYGRKFGRVLYLTWKIPGPSLWELLTVHAKKLLGDNENVIYLWKMCASYNYKAIGIWMTNFQYVVFVSDCETLGSVYKNKDMTEKPHFFQRLVVPFLRNGLFTINGPEYSRHKKVFGIGLQKSLYKYYLQRMPKPMSDFVKALREKAAGGKDVDLTSFMTRRTAALMAISFTSTSDESFHLIVDEISRCEPAIMELIQIQIVNPLYYWLFVNFRSSTKQLKQVTMAALAAFDDFLLELKSRAISGSQQDSNDVQDIAQAMILAHLNSPKCTDEEYCAEGRTMLIGSFETTAFTITTILLLLALHEDVQQRVQDELDSVWQKESPMQVDDLDRLEYVEMVIKETMRLFPPGPIIGRNVNEESNVNGLLLPAGSTIVINIFALHRNPEYFPDPLKFDPTRFSPEASKKLRPYSYLPFSHGLRSCPGQLHGLTMIKLVLSHIVRNFRILPGDKLKSLDDIKVKMSFSMHLAESSLRLVDRSEENAR